MKNRLIAPPTSRHDNPFATCWTRPGALAWDGSRGVDVEAVASTIKSGCGGQIVGPHGSGKSTLLAALSDRMSVTGVPVYRVTIDEDTAGQFVTAANSGDVLLVDGYEKLSTLAGARLRWRCWRLKTKLVVTTHRQHSGLKVLATLAPSLTQVRDLFRQLTSHRVTPIQEDDVIASYHRQRGNVREIWFDLYDLHERRILPACPV